MRTNFQEGEQFLVFQEEDAIILRKTDSLKNQLEEDREFERRTREALKRVEAGEFISIDSNNLEEEMMKW